MTTAEFMSTVLYGTVNATSHYVIGATASSFTEMLIPDTLVSGEKDDDIFTVALDAFVHLAATGAVAAGLVYLAGKVGLFEKDVTSGMWLTLGVWEGSTALKNKLQWVHSYIKDKLERPITGIIKQTVAAEIHPVNNSNQ